ncbi:choline dehydrogenase [Ideonella sp. B7]|uniref:GMC family oxidoreductase n=1 Tax=Ideonella benzenivorans TaxID=2831643 RepID=UPI001CEDDD32|nr:choline dehydrogenase [Ideonella benzenivorans]MCA6215565.1 choline dehydrogenase [Ideonella benzenivorans]
METKFDYVIVGGGSAGCVVANRLSANPAVKVCLIEAGPDDRQFPTNQLVNTPAGTMGLMANPRYDWMYTLRGGQEVARRDIFCPRGKVLGGSSAINGTIYIRGNPRDYDQWARLGNTGWGYDQVLPLFKRHENRLAGGNAFHGTGGELNVTNLRSPQGVSKAFVEAALEAGYPANGDFNGTTQEGFGFFEVNQTRGERMSSARAFLHPVAHRPNLTLLTGTATQRVVLQGRRATGVEVLVDGRRQLIEARREVVLSAGAIGSPQLLMLSGIGPAEHLRSHGIAVMHDLPGVGENFQDHQDVLVIAKSQRHDLFGWSLAALPWMAASPFQFYLARRGPWTSNTVEAGGFLKSNPTLQDPDLQLIIRPLLANQPQRKIPVGHGFSVHISLLRPASRGAVRLASASAADKPDLRPNFLSERVDLERLMYGVRAVRKIIRTPAMAGYFAEELWPGAAADSDAEIEQFVREHVATTFHPAGTCKMGVDERAVVDPQLRVHGIEGLRVADASIMPTIISGNTNAPTIMIGEKCAQMMLAGETVARPTPSGVAAAA